MSSRLENEILGFRTAIEKFSNDEGSKEDVTDVLIALMKVPMSIDILRRTKIGQTLQEAKKKTSNEDIGGQIKTILSKWRKDCKEGAEQKPDAESKSEKKDSETIPKPGLARSQTGDESIGEVEDSRYKLLSPLRQNIMRMFADCFKGEVSSTFSKFLGFNAEAGVYKLHNAEGDQKAYLSKAKSLTFNLKKNQQLRSDIVNGVLQPEILASLSTSELASDEQRDAREETAKQALLARRSDLYEITRNEMLKASGIDPEKGGEFKCRKCKGTKTSHYSLQTRSSDEPMTVFVECLTCGNRWRCT